MSVNPRPASRFGLLNPWTWVLAMGLAGAAFFMGLLAVTANPMLIGLGAGLVGGAFLLAIPQVSTFVVVMLALLSGVLISLSGPFFGRLPWLISMLGFFLFIPAIISLLHDDRRARVPNFVWIGFIFLLYAIAVSLLQSENFAPFVAGTKRYFQVFALMAVLAVLPFSDVQIGRLKKLWFWAAILQLPAALYELLILVPKRLGIGTLGEATDVVAGTFGANQEGGSPNGIMVVFLIITLAFLFARWRSGLLSKKQWLWLSLPMILPLGMGESKVALLMLPLAALLIIRRDLARDPLQHLPLLFGGAVFMGALAFIYVQFFMTGGLTRIIEGTVSYNFGSGGYGTYYLNRTTVMTFWWTQQGLHDPAGFFFGHGLGSSFVGQISGDIGLRFPRHGIALTAISTLLWDLGLIGVGVFVSMFVSAWRTANQLYLLSSDSHVRADLLGIQASIGLFVLMLFYDQGMVNLLPLEVIYSCILGYLGYLCVTSQRKP